MKHNLLSTRVVKFMSIMLAALLTIVAAGSSSAQAASASGRVNGINVTATLYRSQTAASASTTSNSNGMIHTVSLSLWYYYTENGVAKSKTLSTSKQYSSSVNVDLTGSGSYVQAYGAISNHAAYSGSASWSTVLRDPAGFTG